MAAILLVEDEAVIGEHVAAALRADGYDVTWARDGDRARAAVHGRTFDLILLDLGLPDVDGILLCGELRRRQPNALIVMLTARREEMDVIVGLESGADDYITKPFGVGELLARVRAHLRRAANDADATSTYVCGDLTVDLGTRRCLLRGVEVSLRAKEFDLLTRLIASAGQALSRDTLMNDVWGADWFGSTKTLDVHVAAVRRRLQVATAGLSPPPRTPEIATLRGFGYRMEVPQDRAPIPP